MRFVSLDLVAFGSFTKTKLSLGTEPGKLSLVYGPNEAGKSTLLRALSALLFQIPTRTEDAHLHEMGKLRIGAQLMGDSGKVLSVVRRKGNKQTLLDNKDQPLDDKVLSEMMGGVSETLFRQMFALDHDRLREGAEQLLEGQGGLGESLFEAGLGARSLTTALSALKGEADELYKSRGQTPKLNASLKVLRERERERKEAMLSPQAVEAQRQALSEAELEQKRALELRRETLLTRERLERLLRLVPLLGRRERVERDLARVGAVVTLTDAQAARFETLSKELAEARAEAYRVRSQLVSVDAELSALPAVTEIPIDDVEMAELIERFGSHRKALRDLPMRMGEREQLDVEIAAARERLGLVEGSLKMINAQTRARLLSLSDDVSVLRQETSRARLQEKTARARVLELEARVNALPPRRDLTALALTCEEAKAHKQNERILPLELSIKQKTALLERRRRELATSLSFEALSALVLPSRSEIGALCDAHDVMRTKVEALSGERTRVQKELREIEEALSRSEALSELLSEDMLRDARSERDRLWHALSTELQLKTAPVAQEQIRALDLLIRRADEHADRLRRESTLAAEVALKLHQRRSLELTLVRLSESADALALDQEALDVRARAISTRLGLSRVDLPTLRASFERIGELVSGVAELEAMKLELLEHQTREKDLLSRLERALTLSSAAEDGEVRGFSALLAHALKLLAQEQQFAIERERMTRELEGAQHAHRDAGVLLREAEDKRERVELELASLCQGVGLEGRVSGEELRVLLEGLQDIDARLSRRRELSARIEVMTQDAKSFEAEARALCVRALPELSQQPLEDALKVLRERHQHARDVRRDRERLKATKAALNTEREGIERVLTTRADALCAMLAEAGVADESAFRSLFVRAKEREGLLQERMRIEQELVVHADGVGFDALTEQLRDFNVDDARARLIELSERHESLEEDVRQREQQIGRLRAGLETFEQTAGAFELSEDVEAELSAARSMVRRYIEVRLASQLLAREIERYRAQHQGPVLARATGLFKRLTLERYRGLDVEYGDSDRPVLCAVRHDGARVLVSGMSDGTRDQLYLALRLASIERFLETSVALPLVLDDAFVHFDDERTRAALEVLGDLAQRTQVLYFTHHPRVVELARSALDDDHLLVHKLSSPSGTRIVVRDDGPLFTR